MKNNKFCINKNFLILILVSLFTLFSYRFISRQSSLSYKSRAQTISIIPTPTTSLTSDPKKVLEYWAWKVSPKNPENNPTTHNSIYSEDRITKTISLNINDSVKKYYEIKGKKFADYTFLSEVDYKDTYDSSGVICFGGAKFPDPLGLIIYSTQELSRPEYEKNPNWHIKLSLYKNNLNGEVDSFISSWFPESTASDANIVLTNFYYLPYQSFVNAFSTTLQEYKKPMNNGETFLTCDDSYKKAQWLKWARSVITDSSVYNITNNIYPFLPKLDTLIFNKKQFLTQFKAILKKNYPEIVIYPVYEKTFPGGYNNFTFILDGKGDINSCKDVKNGHYVDLFVRFKLLQQYLDYKITGIKLTKLSYDRIVSSKTLINHLNDPNCSKDYISGSSGILESVCPWNNPTTKLTKDNSFYITIRPLDGKEICGIGGENNINTIKVFLNN